MGEKDTRRKEMLDKILKDGAWFCVGQDRFVKIGFSKEDNCYFARECFRKNGGLQGGAYTFGTDWFDISFHGKYIDIYADAETFKHWDISYDAGKTLESEPVDDKEDTAERLLEFCRAADAEVMEGDPAAYRIDGTNFEKILAIRAGLEI